MEILQLKNPTAKDIAEILNLFREIPGRTCTAAAYLEYLNANWDGVALFVVKDNDRITGFTQAEKPGMLDPKCAWLPFSRATGNNKEYKKETLRLAEDWMRAQGAERCRMTTVRKPETIKRAWGFVRSKEVLMEKVLQ